MERTLNPNDDHLDPAEETKVTTSVEVATAIIRAQLAAYDWKGKPLPDIDEHSRLRTVILEHDPIRFGVSESGHYCVENDRNGDIFLYQDVGVAITDFVVLSFEELGVWLNEKIEEVGDAFEIPEYKKLRFFVMKRMDAVDALVGRPKE